MKPLVYCSSNTQRTPFKAPSCALSTTHYGRDKKKSQKKRQPTGSDVNGLTACDWSCLCSTEVLEGGECCVSSFQSHWYRLLGCHGVDGALEDHRAPLSVVLETVLWHEGEACFSLSWGQQNPTNHFRLISVFAAKSQEKVILFL